nr:methyltransferase domain-containing protein [Rhodococcus sp. (in: high G+C Gram-positive bacteria)]
MIADEVFRRGSAGHPSWVVEIDGRRQALPVGRWIGGPGSTLHDLEADAASVALCSGPTLDVGCGPGRLTEALVRAGVSALGIDVSSVAVSMTNARGGVAVECDIFTALPVPGRWAHVILADGNIGIGGDPVALLRRVREMLEPDGTVIVEVDRAESGLHRRPVRWETGDLVGQWFDWASADAAALHDVADEVGLMVRRVIDAGERRFMELAAGMAS